MANLIKKSNRELLIDLVKDPDRKPLLKIFSEVIILLVVYRELPVHYFSRYVFKKGVTNFKDYLPNKYLGNIASFFNDNKVKEVLDNKLFFDFYYRRFNINLPRILMYNINNMFFIDNRSIIINNIHDFTLLLKEMFNQNSLNESVIIKKTWSSSSGKQIFKLSVNQIVDEPVMIDKIYTEVIRSGFLFQETLKQHPGLNKLNSSCLNTMRIDTFMNRDGKVEIISGYLRMSISDSHIDNISSGGCQVGIVLKTGKLKRYGYSLIKTMGVRVLTEHPVTKTVFEDFTIPYFEEAKELVLKVANLNPALRLIGWDVAVGETGPVLVEGNSDYDISGNDLVDGGYLANPIFRKVLHEINYL